MLFKCTMPAVSTQRSRNLRYFIIKRRCIKTDGNNKRMNSSITWGEKWLCICLQIKGFTQSFLQIQNKFLYQNHICNLVTLVFKFRCVIFHFPFLVSKTNLVPPLLLTCLYQSRVSIRSNLHSSRLESGSWHTAYFVNSLAIKM